MKKVRIDKLLLEKGLVRSRERARALIMAGDVLVDDSPIQKAGTSVDPECEIRLRRPPHPYVGRGGVKLRGGLDAFGIDPRGMVAADIGSSTGGFTDCLLMAGAAHVYDVDVDTSQLDWKLRSDSRVTLVEGNARYFEPSWIPVPVDLATIDVSFISLQKIFPAITGMFVPHGICLALVKPQFELGREKVGKGGIVSDPELHREAVAAVRSYGEECGFICLDTCASPITGKEGNQEFFVYLEKS
jgi:23S rRNA (cytidine1920-2'-O)/16S rRNA (cytidine1409-2'-O)-methyltransferase